MCLQSCVCETVVASFQFSRYFMLIFYVLQPQDQDVDASPQSGLSTEIIESSPKEEDEPEGPTMKDIFTEIQQMTEKGPNSILTG